MVLIRIGFRWPSHSCSQNFDPPAPRAKNSSAVRSIFRTTGLIPVGPAGAIIARMARRSTFIARSSVFIGARSNHRTRLRVRSRQESLQAAARSELPLIIPTDYLRRCMRAAMSGANRTLYAFFSHRRTQTDTSGAECFLSLVALIGLSQTCPCDRT